MLISSHKFCEIFDTIRSKKYLIYVFSSIDCDSICATKIFTILCKESGISYVLFPVRGYFDLKKKLKKIRELIIEQEIPLG